MRRHPLPDGRFGRGSGFVRRNGLRVQISPWAHGHFNRSLGYINGRRTPGKTRAAGLLAPGRRAANASWAHLPNTTTPTTEALHAPAITEMTTAIHTIMDTDMDPNTRTIMIIVVPTSITPPTESCS